MTPQEKRSWQEYYEVRKLIVSKVSVDVHEPLELKQKRIKWLKSDFVAFCGYYFPHYMSAPFGWFHKQAAKAIVADRSIFAVLEWPRAHAKSVFADVMLPMYLKSIGQLNGVIIASQNKDKALGLLLDIQAELEANPRYIADYGEQFRFGDWEEGNFSTQDGTGFWAFGRGQSPRGTRKAEKRPNYIVVDDIDDKEIVKNRDRVLDAVDWVREDLLGCFDLKGGRMVIAGNRIHKYSILSHIVGDVEDDDPVNPAIWHSKVFALENPKTHREDQSEKGVPAWKEFYTRQDVEDRMEKMGYRASQREFFHKHIIEGRVFKNEWLVFHDLPALPTYIYIVAYTDPSFKDTKKNDYKAIVCVGKSGKFYDLIDVWVAQTNSDAMVVAHYDMHERLLEDKATNPLHYLEANFIQDVHLDTYVEESTKRGYMLAIRADDRKKPDKFGRIENLTPLFERGLIRINAKLRKNPHFITFKDQLLGFPNAHDDAPDAFEGAVYILNQKTRTEAPATTGGHRRSNRM